MLVYQYPLVDSIELYSPKGGGVYEKQELGDRVSYSRQLYHSRNPVFGLNAKSGISEYYIRIKSSGTISFPISIKPVERFHEENLQELMVLGGLIGIIMVMICYNFFLFLSFKAKVYLYYVLYMSVFFLYLIAHTGISRMTIATGFPYHWLSNEGIVVTSELTLLFIVLFTKEFLNFEEKDPNW